MKKNQIEKRPRGRPTYEAKDEVRELLKALVLCGYTHRQIAEMMGIDRNTMTKHYGDELREALGKANAAVVQSLLRRALYDENPASCIFWCKTKIGMREHADLGAEVKPTVINIAVAAPPARYLDTNSVQIEDKQTA